MPQMPQTAQSRDKHLDEVAEHNAQAEIRRESSLLRLDTVFERDSVIPEAKGVSFYKYTLGTSK